MLAAPLVYALFLASNALISVTDLRLDEKPQRALFKVTPQLHTITEPRPSLKPVLLDAAVKPPPMEREKVRTEGIDPAGQVWTGGLPAEFEPLKPVFAAVSSSPIQARELVAVRAPLPVIPAAAASRGISGSCDVRFDVDTAGRPQNVSAQCTDNVFKTEAERSVRKAEFLPAIRNGLPVAQKNAVYPINFVVE